MKNVNKFKEFYEQYWDMIKDSVDEEGWVYSNEVPYLVDSYFEFNTGKEIAFQKHYSGKWRGYRWRPKELNEKEL